MLVGIDASRAARPRRTGTEGYAHSLISGLVPLLVEQGHGVRLYYNAPPPADLFSSLEGVEERNLPFPRLWTHVRLAWELERHPPDLFFTPAHVIPFTYRGMAIATIHDLGYHYFPRAHPRRQLLYLQWSTQHNARRSQHILADSEATKRDLQHFYRVDPEKVSVVYPGVDPHLAPAKAEAITRVRQRYGLPERYLLYLGTLQPRKNLSRLVRAYAQSGVRDHLVLAGQVGWLAETLQTTIDAQPEAVVERIYLPGYVAEEDKAALLSGALALLYPSLYEGFGFPVLEAQMCETPVLCSDSSSLPEVAGDGALLVNALDTDALADAIAQICRDDDLRAQLVVKGRQNAQRFTWQRAARQTAEIFAELGAEGQAA